LLSAHDRVVTALCLFSGAIPSIDHWAGFPPPFPPENPPIHRRPPQVPEIGFTGGYLFPPSLYCAFLVKAQLHIVSLHATFLPVHPSPLRILPPLLSVNSSVAPISGLSSVVFADRFLAPRMGSHLSDLVLAASGPVFPCASSFGFCLQSVPLLPKFRLPRMFHYHVPFCFYGAPLFDVSSWLLEVHAANPSMPSPPHIRPQSG